MFLTYRYRVKNLEGTLRKQARVVNFVWNYCNESQKSCLRLGKKWLTAFDLMHLTSGTCKELGISSETIGALCQQYVNSRRQHRRPFLRFRNKKSLGWVPIKGRSIKQTDNGFQFGGRIYRVFLSRPLPPLAKICDGSSFAEDARGRWYLNLTIEIPDGELRPIETAVGIDLGLKSMAALSSGEKVENPRYFRELEEKIAKIQRANKKRLKKSVHAKITNCRRDFLHKLSTRIVGQFDWVAVGNVSSSKLAKTKMAKSVNDVGWSSFRDMLQYKSIATGATFKEVDESYSTRACSSCGCMTGPKGVADLGIRTWDCVECGASHDRDINSARNILFGSGHRTPVEGISSSHIEKMPNPARFEVFS